MRRAVDDDDSYDGDNEKYFKISLTHSPPDKEAFSSASSCTPNRAEVRRFSALIHRISNAG